MDDTPLAPPPAELNFVGTPDNFAEVGQQFFDIFVRDGGLKPHHRVLDVGCGVGRMALPLTGYLTPPGDYDGIVVGAETCDDGPQNGTSGFCNNTCDGTTP